MYVGCRSAIFHIIYGAVFGLQVILQVSGLNYLHVDTKA